MSPEEIISEIGKLSHTDRREVLRWILEVEAAAQALSNGEQFALERRQMLNGTESEPQ